MDAKLKLIFLLLSMAPVVYSCGGGSSSCSYTTCTTTWGSWTPGATQGRCVTQTSAASHKYQTHSRNGGCPASTKCTTTNKVRKGCSCRNVYRCSWGGWSTWSPSLSGGTCNTQQKYRSNYQTAKYVFRVGDCSGVPWTCVDGMHETLYRKMCSCLFVHHCSWGRWGSWTGGIARGICGTQTRTRPNNKRIKYIDKRGNCNGVVKTCDQGMQQSQNRKMCNCKKVSRCTANPWTAWSPSIFNGQCVAQRRQQTFSPTFTYVTQLNNCNGIGTTCQSATPDSRTYCSCPYLVCSLTNWGAWTTKRGNKACPIEERYRGFTSVTRYKGAYTNCDNVFFKICPDRQRQERKKVIKCPKITRKPKDTLIGDACSGNESSCGSICTVQCNGVGYDLEGLRFVKCLSTGQWSGTLGYCKDIENPKITCPSYTPKPNDASKNYATVDLPAATANDNSKESVTITVSHTSPIKVVVGTTVKVTYTATDKTGNSAGCVLPVTSIDTEPPQCTFCPKDVIVQVKRMPYAVTWDLPRFFDNVQNDMVSLVSNHFSGQKFPRGRFLVVYTGSDKAGNKAKCQFYVQVSPITCELHPHPKNGVLQCNIQKSGENETYVCSPGCKKGFWFLNNTGPVAYDFYVCGDDGTWRGQNEFDITKNNMGILTNIIPKGQIPWPNCEAGDPPQGLEKNYRILAGDCKNESAIEKLKKDLVNTLKKDILLSALYCQIQVGHCTIENIQVFCSKRRRRDASGPGRMEIKFTLKVEETIPVSDQKQAIQILQNLKRNLSSTITSVKKAVSETLKIKNVIVEDKGTSYVCKPGRVFSVVNGNGSIDDRSKCIECPVGTLYDNTTKECRACPLGTYQEEEGQFSCMRCKDGFSTRRVGESNSTACRALCYPGTYSPTGLSTCIACPQGTYQPMHQGIQCIKCPSRKSTAEIGAVTVEDCTKNAVNIEIRSEGCDDPNKHGGCGQASIKVNNVEHSPKTRGYNVVVLNAVTGKVEAARAFDTNCCSANSKAMLNFISGLGDNKIVLVAIQDEAARRSDDNVFTALKMIGAKEPFQRGYRGSYAFAGYKGAKKPSWMQAKSALRRLGPSEIELTVTLSE